jgi:HSP20 family protein
VGEALNSRQEFPDFRPLRNPTSKEAVMFGNVYSESPLLAQFRRLEQELDEVFGGATPWTGGIRSLPPGTFPAINVGSTEDSVTVYLFAPGIDARKLDISIQENLLTVSGAREVARDDKAAYYRQERFDGDFRRVISLPDDVDPDKVDASYRDGIVQITVRRRESAKPRQIAIR